MERVTGGRKAHFGLRSSIAGRWMFNTLSVVGVLLIIANVCIYYFTRQYYYGSAETYLVSEANATATVLTRLYEDMAVNYSTEVRELIEGFDKKDKMEMMSINKNGEVTLSSSGFSPDESYNHARLRSRAEVRGRRGSFPRLRDRREHHRRDGNDSPAEQQLQRTAVRVLDELIDNQLSGIMLTALLISAGVILVVVFSGMYFVKSICVPLMQISVTAKKLAKGDFSERIAIRNNDEIGELSRVFNDMADELENSEAIKNDFISSVSHELRTPLTAIKGWSETLEAGYDEETYRKGMKVITHETGRLEGMVEELLDFSRIQNGSSRCKWQIPTS